MSRMKDRRKASVDAAGLLADNGRGTMQKDRRRQQDRRTEDMDAEERMLMLSEMPWLISGKNPGT